MPLDHGVTFQVANEAPVIDFSRAVLSDNGLEFCGRQNQHPYEPFLQLEKTEHRTTKVRRAQSNGFVERLHRTLLDEHFGIQGLIKWYEILGKMQTVLDDYLVTYNTKRPQQGRNMKGMTPYAAFKKGLPKSPNKEPRKTSENTA